MVIGIDEVGRGCWAGPLVAAAVMFDDSFDFTEIPNLKLDDSKKISKKQRELAANEIPKFAKVGIGWINEEQIDKVGLTEANRRAMLIAIKQLDYTKAKKIVIDGNINYLKSYLCKDRPCKTNNDTWSYKDSPCIKDCPCKLCGKIEVLVGADGKVAAVSAASIIAKVARDNFMVKQALIYPGFGFEKHVGYGTKLHIEQLAKQGITTLHRKSYKPVKKMIKAFL